MSSIKSPLCQSVVLLSLLLMVPAIAAAEVVSLKVGHAQTLRLEGTPTTVAVGDGDVASASVALDNTLMLIGKRPGTTNVVALDANGSEVTNTVVQVVRADGRRMVSVIRAGQPQAYFCGTGPGCLAVDPGSQLMDDMEADDPAGGAADEAETDQPQTSSAPTVRALN